MNVLLKDRFWATNGSTHMATHGVTS
jgi:hypothetical protein